MEDLEYVSNV
jgi:hypothetical protein